MLTQICIRVPVPASQTLGILCEPPALTSVSEVAAVPVHTHFRERGVRLALLNPQS